MLSSDKNKYHKFQRIYSNSLHIEYPWDVLPVLEDGEGRVISQHLAIIRYLATKFGLAGKTDYEMAKCDEYVEAAADVRNGKIDERYGI